MLLSDVSIKRPVVCIVLALLVLIVGGLAFSRLPVREYPNIESPVVSVDANYPGAAAEVIETQITDPIEEQLSTIDGVKQLNSSSSAGRSRISLEFDLRRDTDEAANDVRDKIGRVVDRLSGLVDSVDSGKDTVVVARGLADGDLPCFFAGDDVLSWLGDPGFACWERPCEG